jgi:3-dehydroquinate dehydratase-2
MMPCKDKKILIINGANLNLTGKREPHIYGSLSFDVFLDRLRKRYEGIELDYYQSNHEGDLVDRIQQTANVYHALVLNAGAYAHTSIALADAVKAVDIPVIEVHISNIFAREAFRQKSYLSAVCMGCIVGLGLDGYRLAVESIIGWGWGRNE